MVMRVQERSWEDRLLSLAKEAEPLQDPGALQPVVDPDRFDQAYRYCEAIVAQHSRTFSLASGLLPADKRRAARALYAFCRMTDDIVDGQQVNPATTLTAWRRLALEG